MAGRGGKREGGAGGREYGGGLSKVKNMLRSSD